MPLNEQLELVPTSVRGLFLDSTTMAYVVIPHNKDTFIEVIGEDRQEIATKIAKMLNPESPSDIKQGWYWYNEQVFREAR